MIREWDHSYPFLIFISPGSKEKHSVYVKLLQIELSNPFDYICKKVRVKMFPTDFHNLMHTDFHRSSATLGIANRN